MDIIPARNTVLTIKMEDIKIIVLLLVCTLLLDMYKAESDDLQKNNIG